MRTPREQNFSTRIRSLVLVLGVAVIGLGLAAWKHASLRSAEAAAASLPEPVESVSVSVAEKREYRPSTTSIGTVLALNSITLRNELAGTVRRVAMEAGQIVEPGELLIALDVSVEEAELAAQTAAAELSKTTLARMEKLRESRVVAQQLLDEARAAHAVAVAQIDRIRAVIERKTIRAPFRARVGIADVHVGQYLNEGTELTTLQGVGSAAHIDFTVSQAVAAALHVGQDVNVSPGAGAATLVARIVAVDAKVDPVTRNALVRARIADGAPAPGASVRVEVPTGPATSAVAIPVTALRKGPSGDVVFVIETDSAGQSRARAQSVQSGSVIDDQVLVFSGLTAGQRVATSGSFKLRDAVLVAIASDSKG